MELQLYRRGERADILVALDKDGASAAHAFIESLSRAEEVRIVRCISEFAERGVIRNEQKFRHEGNGIYVFKGHQARLFCCFLPVATRPSIVLLSGYTKKRDRMDRAAYDRAMRAYHAIIDTGG